MPIALSDFDLVEIYDHGTAADAEQAFNTLCRRHKAFVIRVAMRYVSDH